MGSTQYCSDWSDFPQEKETREERETEGEEVKIGGLVDGKVKGMQENGRGYGVGLLRK